MCICETNVPSFGGYHSPGSCLVLGRDGADEVKRAATFRTAGPFGSRERRRFAPRPQGPSSFWSSLGARFALLPLLGAVTAVALPPVYVLPALVLGFSGLLLAVRESRSVAGALFVGWTFGFGYYLTGLYWIGNSFLVDAARYGWMAVPAVIGLSAFLAVFPALAVLGARLLSRLGLGELVSLAAAWTATEWLRGNLMTGFPWNLIGYVWTVSDQTLQGAALFGVYGLSLITVLAAAAPAAVWNSGSERRGALRWLPLLLLVLFPAGLWIAGELRLQATPTPGDQGLRIRIVQGNIPQALKWQPAERDGIVRRYLSMSAIDRPANTAVQIWPETALPVALANDAESRAAAAAVIPEGGVLITGSVRFSEATSPERQLRNSLLAISDAGEVLAVYDKARLVPFGEYVPLRSLLPFKKLVEGRGDFAPGPAPATVALPGVPPFQPLICYEAIFPGWTAPDDGAPAQWLLNVTNDAWFGRSSGPYQHFQMARARAVERGLPLVRAANTGISAVVDALGRVSARLGLGETGVLDAALPAALAAGTPYSRYGEGIVLAMAMFAVAASVGLRRFSQASRTFGKR